MLQTSFSHAKVIHYFILLVFIYKDINSKFVTRLPVKLPEYMYIDTDGILKM